MTQWQTVAEGTSFWNLRDTIGNVELPKGTRMRVVMETSASWLFDIAGAEHVFKAVLPDDMKLIDVWGEGSEGIVEMEVTGTFWWAIWGFLKAHWVALVIGTIVLATVVSFITVMVKVPAVAQIPVWLIIGAAGGILLLAYVSARGSRAPTRKA